jgi:hypothetical protein
LLFDKWFNAALQALARRLAPRVLSLIERSWHDGIVEFIAKTVDEVVVAKESPPGSLGRFVAYVPTETMPGSRTGEYMAASHPLTRDFLHIEYAEFSRLLGHRVLMHRKLWEWAFIYHRLQTYGCLRPGMRGLVFGVGTERLPAVFANKDIEVVATDAPAAEAEAGGWGTDQHSAGRDSLFYPEHVSREKFERLVTFESCDMNDIPEHLTGFDFCWSSCAFEHLGTLERGIDFIVNSTERTLKVGGIGCHTTEFNLSSDEETLAEGGTVIYRKRDLEQLRQRLEERGHKVEPLRLEPGDMLTDYLVDAPPYAQRPHLKLLLASYVATSVGSVVTRGR